MEVVFELAGDVEDVMDFAEVLEEDLDPEEARRRRQFKIVRPGKKASSSADGVDAEEVEEKVVPLVRPEITEAEAVELARKAIEQMGSTKKAVSNSTLNFHAHHDRS